MYFVISPTKEMREEKAKHKKSIPHFIEDSKTLMQELRKLSVLDIQTLMKVNEKIAKSNYDRYANFRFDGHGQCAITTYYGLQYKQLNLAEYDTSMLTYMNHHVRILSGLYGVLKPFDSIYPYRLEMKFTPLHLYSFWQDKIQAYFEGQQIINVASKEYSDVLCGDVYHVHFKIRRQGKLITQSTQAKMARGQFMHFVIVNKVKTLAQLKQFASDGYAYDASVSSKKEFVFVKED